MSALNGVNGVSHCCKTYRNVPPDCILLLLPYLQVQYGKPSIRKQLSTTKVIIILARHPKPVGVEGMPHGSCGFHVWGFVCRNGWHLAGTDKVLRRLRWGNLGFANLRYAPGKRLDWWCADKQPNRGNQYEKLNCDFVGNWIFPSGFEPMNISEVYLSLVDDWDYSIIMTQVCQFDTWFFCCHDPGGTTPEPLGKSNIC
jgi:hypothetical protein